MRTAIIFNQFSEGITYCVLNGDYSHFQGKYINSSDLTEEETNEICRAFYDENWEFSPSSLTLDEFRQEIVNGAKLVECGFMP